MPTYDYVCKKCGHRFELFQSIKAEAAKDCPICQGPAERLLGIGGGMIFKGTGFYATDHRSKSYTQKAKQESNAAISGGEAGTTSKSETKPGTKTEAKTTTASGETK